MSNPTMYRQGDVLIVRVDEIPADAKLINRTKRGVILAEGEVTGHAHRIASRHASLYRTESDAKYMRVMGPAPRVVEQVIPATVEHHPVDEEGYLIEGAAPVLTPERTVTVLKAAPGGVVLKHEEHSPVVLPPGNYRVSIHTEYQPGELPRQVAD